MSVRWGVAAPAFTRREPSSAHELTSAWFVRSFSLLLGAHRETKSFTRIPEGAIVERGFIHIIPNSSNADLSQAEVQIAHHSRTPGANREKQPYRARRSRGTLDHRLYAQNSRVLPLIEDMIIGLRFVLHTWIDDRRS